MKKEVTKKISLALQDKIADFAYKKRKDKLACKAYVLKGIKFYDNNTACVEFGEIADVGEYIGYGKWAAKDTPGKDITITKNELDKLLA